MTTSFSVGARSGFRVRSRIFGRNEIFSVDDLRRFRTRDVFHEIRQRGIVVVLFVREIEGPRKRVRAVFDVVYGSRSPFKGHRFDAVVERTERNISDGARVFSVRFAALPR